MDNWTKDKNVNTLCLEEPAQYNAKETFLSLKLALKLQTKLLLQHLTKDKSVIIQLDVQTVYMSKRIGSVEKITEIKPHKLAICNVLLQVSSI